MGAHRRTQIDEVLAWCELVLGPIEVISEHTRVHPDRESPTHCLYAPGGYCYLKIYDRRSAWQNEVYAYTHWAGAFGACAPVLLAVRDVEPLAVVVSQLPGKIVDKAHLTIEQQCEVWRTAGEALAGLHTFERGQFFGRFSQSHVGQFACSAIEHISVRLDSQTKHAVQAGYLATSEKATVAVATRLVQAFEDERPAPCHGDYCSANWVVNEQGVWIGVIDFERACWDVPVVDLARDPEWQWIRRPELWCAFLDGYVARGACVDEQQLMVARTEYALDAIIWGHENGYTGFEREGHTALAHLAKPLF